MATLREYLNAKIKSKGSTLAKEKAKAKKYKSISAAKKAGALYYTNKAGKVMAAVFAEDLKKPLAPKKSARPKASTLRAKPTSGGSTKTANEKAVDAEIAANNKKIALAMDKTGFKPISIEDEVSVSKDEVSASKDEVSTSEEDFLDKLYESESSNNSKSDRTNKDGKRFVGLGNFGQDRIDDAQKPVAQGGMGISFTLDEFKNNIKLQKKVATWHIKGIDKAIDRLGNLSKGYNRNGLRAVAHLGGITGMKNFVKNQDNPEDELGTSLFDYYTKFS